MTYKQPDGLDPRRYKNRASAPVPHVVVRRSETSQYAVRERRALQTRTRKGAGVKTAAQGRRVVTMPNEAVVPPTWAERHARYQSQQTVQSVPERLVPRTLAQTGRPAPVGQRQARKALPRQGTVSRIPSRVPVRSGKLQRSGGLWRRFLGLLFVLVIVAGGIGFALLSPTFRVQQVEVSGTQNQKLISSIRQMGMQGQAIFLLDQAALVTRLEALPPVVSASLGVQLPSTVTVSVEERVPVLLWQAGQSIFGLAQDGTVIAPQSELSGTDHLELVVDTRRVATQVRPGVRFAAAEMVFVEQVFEQAPGIEGVGPFSLQYIDSIIIGGHSFPANQVGSGSYMLVSANGWQAYLGDAQSSNSLANRLLELRQILSIARQQRLQLATIDLRFGLRPTYTLKS